MKALSVATLDGTLGPHRHDGRSRPAGVHGRSQISHAHYTSFERATESPEEVVAIHYDSYRNLVAMGVIRAPRVATLFTITASTRTLPQPRSTTRIAGNSPTFRIRASGLRSPASMPGGRRSACSR